MGHLMRQERLYGAGQLISKSGAREISLERLRRLSGTVLRSFALRWCALAARVSPSVSIPTDSPHPSIKSIQHIVESWSGFFRQMGTICRGRATSSSFLVRPEPAACISVASCRKRTPRHGSC
jgi:hypothetical protein